MLKTLLQLFLVILFFNGCTGFTSKKKELSASEKLKRNLISISGNHTLLGQQEAMAYGIGWQYEPNQSDIKKLTGCHPAMMGWDLGKIGHQRNINGVDFDSLRSLVRSFHQMGGINTFSWHADNPETGGSSRETAPIMASSLLPDGIHSDRLDHQLDLIADFLLSLTTEEGEIIPVIFRPWHEMNGDWFWWGTKNFSPDEFKALFRHTILYLKNKKGVKNMLIAYSPDRMINTREEYLEWYPGDDVVDILGLDDYYDFTTERLDLVVLRLSILADLAKEKNKISAFTETGSDRLAIDQWYTKNLLHVLNANEKTRQIAYVMVWRNADTSHFYVPYPSHCQAKDFINFVAENQIVLLDEYKQILAE